MSNSKRSTHWILWPFEAIWRLVTWILNLTGRFLLALLGSILVIVGIFISLSIIGAIVGVPMILFGFLMFLRALF